MNIAWKLIWWTDHRIVRSFAVRSHMFVTNEQGGYEYCRIWYRLINVWMAKWWRVWYDRQLCANFCVWWLWVVCQCLSEELQRVECWFLYMVFIGITGNCGCGSRLFFMFLMMRCSGYTRASRVRVRFLSSSCRMWSSEMIMLYRSAWD